MVLELDGGKERKTRVVGNPIKFLENPEIEHVYPPKLGEHSRGIICDMLGVTQKDYEKFCDEGIVFDPGKAEK